MIKETRVILSLLVLQPSLIYKIKLKQDSDSKLIHLKEMVKLRNGGDFQLVNDGTVYFRGRICVPNEEELKHDILAEAHATPYSIHPGSTKMYRDLRMHYWWPKMKKNVTQFVEHCLVC